MSHEEEIAALHQMVNEKREAWDDACGRAEELQERGDAAMELLQALVDVYGDTVDLTGVVAFLEAWKD